MNFSKRKDKPMNKILSIIVVFVVSLSLAGVAVALPPRAPTTICLQTVNTATVYVLVMKPGTNVRLSDGVMKFYDIQGAIITSPGPSGINMPLAGSGYVEGNVFHFTFDSTYHIDNTPYFVQAEGLWDVVAKEGTMYAYISISGNFAWSLQQVSCTDQVVLYSEESEAGLLNEESPFLPPNQ
jgi:hypothetical protein